MESLERRELMAGDTATAAGAASESNAGWVDNLYTDVLDRHASAAENQYWTDLLARGVRRDTIAMAIISSREARGRVVADYYEDYLGRKVDEAGLDFWLNVWDATGGPDVVNAALIGSQEFYNAHGGTNRGAIQGLYNELLGRYAADSEVDYWNDVMGNTPLTNVALGFVRSGEYRLSLTNAWYAGYLNRPVDKASGQYWVSQMNSGLSQAQLQAILLGSAEFGAMSVFNVAAFGAVGDGVTDDSAAIQAAFDAAKAAGGGKVVFGKPSASYLIANTVTLTNARNIIIDATEAVFTEETTNGVANLLESFRIQNSRNIVWKNGIVQGSEYQGTSVTHGGVSTGYHAYMMADPDPAHEVVPVFLRVLQTDHLTVDGLRVSGRLRGIMIQQTNHVVINGMRFEGILDGSFQKGRHTNADEEGESDVVRFNAGVTSRGGTNISLLDSQTFQSGKETRWIGSFYIAAASYGIPVGVTIRDFRIDNFQDHAFLLSTHHAVVEHGTIQGGPLDQGIPARGGYGAISFRGGSNNTVRGLRFTNVRVALEISITAPVSNYKFQHIFVDRVSTAAVYSHGSSVTGLEVSKFTVLNHLSSVRAVIDLVDARNVKVVDNVIRGAVTGTGISIQASVTSTGNIISGNQITNARYGIFVNNVSQSQFLNNVGTDIKGGTPKSSLIQFRNTTDSVVSGNVHKDPGGTAVYVPVGTVWNQNTLQNNVGGLDVGS